MFWQPEVYRKPVRASPASLALQRVRFRKAFASAPQASISATQRAIGHYGRSMLAPFHNTGTSVRRAREKASSAYTLISIIARCLGLKCPATRHQERQRSA